MQAFASQTRTRYFIPISYLVSYENIIIYNERNTYKTN